MEEINLGGKIDERLYLKDAMFYHNFELVNVKKTDLPNMEDLIVRHYARYYFVKSFLKNGQTVLDFPCGSGYASKLFKGVDINYIGADNCPITIKYAKRFYCGNPKTRYMVRDLKNPILDSYDVIACVEGFEHIDFKSQKALIHSFYQALNPGGTLIISSPEAEVTGPNPFNKYHLSELTKTDFGYLLSTKFINFDILTKRDTMHVGGETKTLFGVCHKEV